MSEEEKTLLMIRGVIAGAPADLQRQVAERATQLRDLVGIDNNDGIGTMALALVGAELAVKA